MSKSYAERVETCKNATVQKTETGRERKWRAFGGLVDGPRDIDVEIISDLAAGCLRFSVGHDPTATSNG